MDPLVDEHDPPQYDQLIPPHDDQLIPPHDDQLIPPHDDQLNPPNDDPLIPPHDDQLNPPHDDQLNPPHDDPLIPPYDPTNSPQQQIEQVEYHAHMDLQYAQLPLDPHDHQQQIEQVECQLPSQQHDHLEQPPESYPDEDGQLHHQQIEPQDQYLDNPVDYAEDQANSRLFMFSRELSRVPEDLQTKLRNAYFKVVRQRDTYPQKMNFMNLDIRAKNQVIHNLNKVMEQKDAQLLSLIPAKSKTDDEKANEANDEGAPEGAPPRLEYPPNAPAPLITAVNFAAERFCLHQQIKWSNEEYDKVCRETVESNKEHMKRYSQLKVKLHESNENVTLLEADKQIRTEQILEMEKQMICFKAKMDRFEKLKNRELKQATIEQLRLKNEIVQLTTRLAEFEQADSERFALAQNALKLQGRAELELKRFKKVCYRDVRSLQEQKEKLTQELAQAQTELAAAKRPNLRRKVKDLHPELFVAGLNPDDFFHALLIEKDKNVQLTNRIKELEKDKANFEVLMIGGAKNVLGDNVEDFVEIDESAEVDNVPPPLIEAESESDDSEFLNGFQQLSLDGPTAGDRYISLIGSTERFWAQNKTLIAKLEALQAELKLSQELNLQMVSQIERQKLEKAEVDSERVKLHHGIQSTIYQANIYVEENCQLRTRIEDRNAKLKQLDDNLVESRRENEKWLTEMGLAQYKTRQAERLIEELNQETVQMNREMVRLKTENEQLKQDYEDLSAEMHQMNLGWVGTLDELKQKRHKLRQWKVAIVELKGEIAELTNQEYDGEAVNGEFEDETESEDDNQRYSDDEMYSDDAAYMQDENENGQNDDEEEDENGGSSNEGYSSNRHNRNHLDRSDQNSNDENPTDQNSNGENQNDDDSNNDNANDAYPPNDLNNDNENSNRDDDQNFDDDQNQQNMNDYIDEFSSSSGSPPYRPEYLDSDDLPDGNEDGVPSASSHGDDPNDQRAYVYGPNDMSDDDDVEDHNYGGQSDSALSSSAVSDSARASSVRSGSVLSGSAQSDQS